MIGFFHLLVNDGVVGIVQRGMREYGQGLWSDAWGAGASAMFTVLVFVALPVLNIAQPQTIPLVEAVFALERPVYVDVEALLSLLRSDRPAAIDDEQIIEGSTEEPAEIETVEVVASTEGRASGTARRGGGAVSGPRVATTGYRIKMTKTVATPSMVIGYGKLPPGASEAQMGEFMAAVRAGSGIRSSRRRKSRCKKENTDVFPQNDGSFEIHRSLVEYYTSSIKNFSSLGWSGPYNEDGVRGWKISGFGCNSPLHFAGLRRGDIVKTINGKNTNTWFQVFGAYTKLKRHDDFIVAVLRKGELIELRYRLI